MEHPFQRTRSLNCLTPRSRNHIQETWNLGSETLKVEFTLALDIHFKVERQRTMIRELSCIAMQDTIQIKFLPAGYAEYMI
jgi:hypothetical protein